MCVFFSHQISTVLFEISSDFSIVLKYGSQKKSEVDLNFFYKKNSYPVYSLIWLKL
jgi:hypothetical protein